MTWETKDVLMLVAAIGGVAAAWGIAQTKVASIAAELREFKRDTQVSLRSQGERLGKIETFNVVTREVSKALGHGTPAMGTLVAAARAATAAAAANAAASGQVQQHVDGESSEDDHPRR
jgi:hypothetical protein